MNIIEIILLLTGIVVSGAGLVALIQANRLLKISNKRTTKS